MTIKKPEGISREYSIDGVNWQSETVFKDVPPITLEIATRTLDHSVLPYVESTVIHGNHTAGEPEEAEINGATYLVRRCAECGVILEMKRIYPVILYGDANGDGKVTAGDIVRLKKYFAAYDPDTLTSAVPIGEGADVNGDDKIDSADIVRLKKYFAEFDSETETSKIKLGPDD